MKELERINNEPKTKVEASSWIVNTPPTEKQISYIKGICEVLEIDYKEPKTKGEATVWLNHFVPFYNRKCEENELEWEANHSELMDNCGDWR